MKASEVEHFVTLEEFKHALLKYVQENNDNEGASPSATEEWILPFDTRGITFWKPERFSPTRWHVSFETPVLIDEPPHGGKWRGSVRIELLNYEVEISGDRVLTAWERLL